MLLHQKVHFWVEIQLMLISIVILQVKDIWRKCLKRKHSFTICKYDKNPEKLKVVIQSHSMVILAQPYGVTPSSKLRGFTRPSELAIAIIRALLELVREMHGAGCSLDGKISIENLCWLSDRKVKLSRSGKVTLLNWFPTRAERDFAAIHDLIRDVVFQGYLVPSELTGIMKLLVNDPIRYEELILNNIILLDDVHKISEYAICFQQLQQVQKHSELIYRIALTYIKERMGWKQDVTDNSALTCVLTHKGGIAFAGKTKNEGPAIFGRHCCAHLLDYSIDPVDQTILFTIADEFAMIELCLPGLFSEVQRALFEITHILFPKELTSLKVSFAIGEKLPIYHKIKKKTKRQT